KDRNGKVVPNTYLMSMDYSGINYDYNDNVYLITNLKPVSPPAAPTGLVASASGAGISLNWNDSTDANLAGYNVYRSSSANGTFTKLNTMGLLTSSDYFDSSATPGATSFYHVTAVDKSNNESDPSSASALRPSNDTTAPLAPKNLA